ncbi:MAG TPA: glycosyltransferase [Bryobacteraceae bacterium]|nr:glycosyltransferase [Bryobacteraceae bacterium]
MKLSILIPVYNERGVVERSLAQVLNAPLPENMERELIVVDDRSTDGTGDVLDRIAACEPRIRLLRHPINQGKGAAVRTAIEHATGEFCIIQDADLEYDPNEYSKLLQPLLDGRADAVFGSRYLAGEQTRVLPFWHSLINKGLTTVSNMFCNLNITDMETCYKLYRTELLKSIPIRSNRFGIEPEITMKTAKRKLRIYEVPISYHGRTYEEGKKIGWKDGLKVFGVILRFWLIDDLYTDPYGRGSLNNVYGTPAYVNWMTGILRPHVGDRVLEIGAGIGNLTGRLMGRRLRYVAGEHDPLYLHALRNRFLRTPNVEVRNMHPEDPAGWNDLESSCDTVLCVNILEYASDPRRVLEHIRCALVPGGMLLVLVPQGRGVFGTVDETLGLRRRFDRTELGQLLRDSGFELRRTHQLNRVGKPGWWLSSRVLRSRHVNKLALKIFDKTVWIWRRVDWLAPWSGLSLIVAAQRVR